MPVRAPCSCARLSLRSEKRGQTRLRFAALASVPGSRRGGLRVHVVDGSAVLEHVPETASLRRRHKSRSAEHESRHMSRRTGLHAFAAMTAWVVDDPFRHSRANGNPSCPASRDAFFVALDFAAMTVWAKPPFVVPVQESILAQPRVTCG